MNGLKIGCDNVQECIWHDQTSSCLTVNSIPSVSPAFQPTNAPAISPTFSPARSTTEMIESTGDYLFTLIGSLTGIVLVLCVVIAVMFFCWRAKQREIYSAPRHKKEKMSSARSLSPRGTDSVSPRSTRSLSRKVSTMDTNNRRSRRSKRASRSLGIVPLKLIFFFLFISIILFIHLFVLSSRLLAGSTTQPKQFFSVANSLADGEQSGIYIELPKKPFADGDASLMEDGNIRGSENGDLKKTGSNYGELQMKPIAYGETSLVDPFDGKAYDQMPDMKHPLAYNEISLVERDATRVYDDASSFKAVAYGETTLRDK